LIPKHRLTLDATYQPDAMCDFYGFNGYQSVYNQDFHKWKKDPAKMGVLEDYQTRAFYKYKRDLFRFAAVFLCVAIFILSGLEHCIANMYYFSVAGVWNCNTLLTVLLMTLGNSLGSWLMPLAEKFRN
jgi:hypothetical protein